MDRPNQDSSEEARLLHEDELAEDSAMIPAESDEDPDLEGYDEEQRAEVLEAESTDPFNRPVMNNMKPDEGDDDPFPDEDSEIDDQP